MRGEIAIIGLGHIGIPLAIEFDKGGYSVVGYDIDAAKIQSLEKNVDPTKQYSSDYLAAAEIEFSDDPIRLEDSDFVLITVPTPLNEQKDPDLTILESAGMTVGRFLSPGTTVVLESTVYPGATREILIPALEETSNMEAGTDFNVGHSPERINPGDDGPDFTEITKIVSGFTDATTDQLAELYESIMDAGVHRAPSLEAAEAAKCLENTQRDTNIAIINEFAMACDELNVDSDAVLEAAATKWNFHDYSPGLVGGHCLPVDPYYLMHAYEQANYPPRLIQQARRTNEKVATHLAERTLVALDKREVMTEMRSMDDLSNRDEVAVRRSNDRVLVLGLTYKANVADIRNSATGTVIQSLRQEVQEVVGFDPHANVQKSEQIFDIPVQESLDALGFDAVLVTVNHDEFIDLDLATLKAKMNERPVLVDVPGTFADRDAVDSEFIYEKL